MIQSKCSDFNFQKNNGCGPISLTQKYTLYRWIQIHIITIGFVLVLTSRYIVRRGTMAVHIFFANILEKWQNSKVVCRCAALIKLLYSCTVVYQKLLYFRFVQNNLHLLVSWWSLSFTGRVFIPNIVVDHSRNKICYRSRRYPSRKYMSGHPRSAVCMMFIILWRVTATAVYYLAVE